MPSASRMPIPDEMMRNHDLVVAGRRQCRGGQHQFHRLRRHGLLRKRSRPRHPRPPQWLGHPHPPSRARHGLLGLPAVLAPARRRSVPDQRHRREILGSRTNSFVASFEAVMTPIVRAATTARCPWPARVNGAARRRRPIGGPGARSTCCICAAAASSAIRAGRPPACAPCSRLGRRPSQGIDLDTYARDHPELRSRSQIRRNPPGGVSSVPAEARVSTAARRHRPRRR